MVTKGTFCPKLDIPTAQLPTNIRLTTPGAGSFREPPPLAPEGDGIKPPLVSWAEAKKTIFD